MDYRNERDALRGRVENLEHDLGEARRELQAARAPRRSSTLLTVIAVVVVIGSALGLMILIAAMWKRTSVTPYTDEPPNPKRAPRAAPASIDYLKDATSVPRLFKEKLRGPVRIRKLTVLSDIVIAEIQDPKKKSNVDRYQLRDGVVADGEPVRLHESPAAKLDEALVDIDSVDFAALPGIVADAVRRLSIEEGRVSLASLKRGLPFTREVRWRIDVEGPRRSGSVQYDTAGGVKEVSN
jgi:hypothetical protein